jgi:hypothetical protein
LTPLTVFGRQRRRVVPWVIHSSQTSWNVFAAASAASFASRSAHGSPPNATLDNSILACARAVGASTTAGSPNDSRRALPFARYEQIQRFAPAFVIRNPKPVRASSQIT